MDSRALPSVTCHQRREHAARGLALRVVVASLTATACHGDGREIVDGDEVDGSASLSTGSSTGATDSASVSQSGSTSSADGSGSTTDDTKFDLGVGPGVDMGVLRPTCEVVDDMDAVGDCEDFAPPDAFEPATQWDFIGPPGFEYAIVTPLVVNMTDDNADGSIDLCDIPDVIVVAGPWITSDTPPARIYVLDGETGVPHFSIDDELVQWGGTPAVGDIDGDGLPEIVTSRPDNLGALVAFEHDGTLKWQSAPVWGGSQASAVALADIDADGDVEIIAGGHVLDHNGTQVWAQGSDAQYSASAAADLDGDGQMEILTASGAYRNDGSLYWAAGDGGWAHPSIANLDGDADPEVLYAVNGGIMLYNHDGSLVWGPIAPVGGQNDWNRPINVHNYDADPDAEFGAAEPGNYTIFNGDGSIVWTVPVADPSGQAGGTAFDFIGAGIAQAIYQDETNVYVFDDAGQTLMDIPYKSGTIIQYPTVADIDNDGSAEILVISNPGFVGGATEFTVRAVRDVEDRWVQGRRIWNQHTYHVTNVREDGTIPQHEPKHWQLLNTFRTQAQIQGGGVCTPDPRG
jgi:hypothetical protein